jgi:nucleoid-associated protein YgaU
MAMMPRCGLLALGLLIALTGCGQGQANGVRITERGVFLNDAAHNRKDAEQTIVEHFTPDLGPHWTMSVAISPDPRLIEARNDLDSEFRWNAVAVTVTLAGNGLLAEPLVSDDRIRNEITEFLHKLQEPKGQPVTVTVVRTLAKVDQLPAITPATPGVVRSYTLQANDTLADISSAFYGTPNRWRDLITANPGLDPAALTPGTVINIP